MAILPLCLILLAALVLLFAAKFIVVLGMVVACATFSFPLGLMGMVALGVLLLFLLAPRHKAF